MNRAGPETVVFWGNCQAAPLADLLSQPLAEQGLRVVAMPPVYLMTETELHQAQRAVTDAAYLISQPIADNYRLPGCGTAQLASWLGPRGQLLTFPVLFHIGAYPYQVHGHGAGGERVDAPITDYHDLRVMVAAERQLTVDQALAWWPAPAPSTVREVAERSLQTLREREARTDVAVSALLDPPTALWTMSHPANRLLAGVAEVILRALGRSAPVPWPDREYLGARRAPLEKAVVAGYGWPADVIRSDWIVDGQAVSLRSVLTSQLDFYRVRADVVADCRIRHHERLQHLGL